MKKKPTAVRKTKVRDTSVLMRKYEKLSALRRTKGKSLAFKGTKEVTPSPWNMRVIAPSSLEDERQLLGLPNKQRIDLSPREN